MQKKSLSAFFGSVQGDVGRGRRRKKNDQESGRAAVFLKDKEKKGETQRESPPATAWSGTIKRGKSGVGSPTKKKQPLATR